MTIMYKFKITYSSGLTAEMVSEKDRDAQCLETFGLPVEQAEEMGCFIEQLEAKDVVIEDAPPDPPDPGDVTGTVNAFSAENPTQITTDVQDEGMLVVGQTITLEALTGDQSAFDFINGKSVAVLGKEPTTLDLDLSAHVVEGLTADFVLDTAPESSHSEKIEESKEDGSYYKGPAENIR